MSNWTQLIPAKIRNTLYLGFGVLSLSQAAILAYCAAIQTAAPVWAIGGGAVLGVIGGAFGFVAAGNTNVTAPADGRYEAGRTEDSYRIPNIDLRSLHRLVSFEVPEDLSAVTLVINGEDYGTVPARNGTVNYILDKSIPNGTVTVTALDADGEHVAETLFTFE